MYNLNKKNFKILKEFLNYNNEIYLKLIIFNLFQTILLTF